MVKAFMRHCVGLGAAAIISVFGLPMPNARADILTGFSVSMQYLIDHPDTVLQVDDKLFSGFEATSVASSNATAIDLNNLIVTPQIATINNIQEIGLRFQIVVGGAVSVLQGKDITLGFNLTTTFGDDRIVDDYLSVNGGARGGGQVDVSETLVNEHNQSVGGNLFVFQEANFGSTVDVASFNPQDFLHITKDINLYAEQTCEIQTETCSDRAFLSDFSQLFSQLPPDRDIPEPSSMILLGLGMVGLRFVQRKRSSK